MSASKDDNTPFETNKQQAETLANKRQSLSSGSKEDTDLNVQNTKAVNEVADIRNARWWAPPEAYWHVAGYTLHKQMPSVERLSVHMDHQQNVFGELNNLEFESDREQLLKSAKRSDSSQHTQWFM